MLRQHSMVTVGVLFFPVDLMSVKSADIMGFSGGVWSPGAVLVKGMCVCVADSLVKVELQRRRTATLATL